LLTQAAQMMAESRYAGVYALVMSDFHC